MSNKKDSDLNDCIWIKQNWIHMCSTVTVWTKWQIVIPSEVRKELNINPWDNLITFTKHGKAIALIKTDDLNDFLEYMQKEIEVLKKLV